MSNGNVQWIGSIGIYKIMFIKDSQLMVLLDVKLPSTSCSGCVVLQLMNITDKLPNTF